MTSTDEASEVNLHVLRSLIDEARAHRYDSGVLGVRARPMWTGPETFTYRQQAVRVAACASSLAVREALRDRAQHDWLVVLTDRPDDDLGASILGHFTDFKLRRPDPWDAVRSRFAARTVDPALTATKGHKDVAIGLLAATPSTQWPPAPAGALTRQHALGCVAHEHLGLPDDAEIDAISVLTWTTTADVAARVADLRTLAGDALVGAVLDFLAERTGAAAAPVRALFAGGQIADAVPLGVVVGLLTEAEGSAGAVGLVRLEPRFAGPHPAHVLRAWALDATAVVLDRLVQARSALTRADDLLAAAQAEGLAVRSTLLRSGLTARLERLAEALRVAARTSEPSADVESAWQAVESHRLAATDHRAKVFHAAVRLVRWLTADDPPLSDLTDTARRYLDVEAFVDIALNDAAAGVGEDELSQALSQVCDAVQRRRIEHDRQFAAALAREGARTPTPVLAVEDVLAQRVLPLAKNTPVLLLVIDGMSASVAAEVVSDLTGPSGGDWLEVAWPTLERRELALAVLPTLTRHSRTSLLTGRLASGEQPAEQAGFTELIKAHGLPAGALFHKKPLEEGTVGRTLSPDVAAAVDDVTGKPLVACVLNTVDDALDRSDPGGTVWSIDSIKHLRPLLERARAVGRTVVLVSDHGHVIERRQGRQRSASGLSSGRSKQADEAAGPDEVLVSGDRVLDHGGRAVLAVDEDLRYGPLKAGYHGGAAAAEALIPVLVLVPGVRPVGLELRELPPAEPSWWWGSVTDVPAQEPLVTLTPTLFDVPEAISVGLAQQLTQTAVYRQLRDRSGRVPVTDEAVERLVTALLAAPDGRLAAPAVAAALGEPRTRLRGAVSSVQRLLNVEGFSVLSTADDGATYRLDEDLLREQFELPA